MTDYSELKRLAEGAAKGPWEYKNGQLLGQKGSDGYRYNDAQIDVMSCCNADDETMEFIAAASPSVILAILAELEALRAANKMFTYGRGRQA